jgi:group I intron endonuclease
MTNKKYIIYKFTNIINGKVYIGVTNRGIKTRRYEHILGSRTNPKFKFHQAIKKYGIDSFKEEILVENVMTRDEANKLEIYYISIFDSYKNGYNMTQGGGNRGEFKHTDESKEKMSKSHLGKKISNEHSKNISNSLKGKAKSIEHRLNVIKAITGLKRSEEEKINMSNRMKGKFIKDKNPAAIKIKIYDSKENLKFICDGNFEYVCKENGLPSKALRKSYYNNGKPIYSGKTIKKEVLIANKEFIGWFAIKQS